MAEYIEREALKSKKVYSVERHEYVVPVAEIDWQPTADVVPRAEHDLFVRLHDELEDELAETYDKLENAKREVAREIFEEMQSCLTKRHWDGLDIVSFEFDAVKYAELKKKYTEESNG